MSEHSKNCMCFMCRPENLTQQPVAVAKSELAAADGCACHALNPEHDPEYQRFLEAMAKHCRCTPLDERPCAGVCAGGLCDDMHRDEELDDYRSDDDE